MASIWESGNPLTIPSRGSALFAGLVIGAVALGSLALGLSAGWQRGESRGIGAGGGAAPTNAIDVSPLERPEVSLRDPMARPEPAPTNAAVAAPATNTATPAAAAPEGRIEEERPDEEAPTPTIAAPPQPPATTNAAPTETIPSPNAEQTPPTQPAAPF